MNFCPHFMHSIMMILSNDFVIVFCRCPTSLNLYGNGLDGMKLQSGHTTRTWQFGRYHSHVCISYACIFCIFFYWRIFSVYAWFDYKCLDIFIFRLTGAYLITFFADVLAFGVAFFATRIYLANWWVYFLSCFVCFI